MIVYSFILAEANVAAFCLDGSSLSHVQVSLPNVKHVHKMLNMGEGCFHAVYSETLGPCLPNLLWLPGCLQQRLHTAHAGGIGDRHCQL